VTCVSVDLSTHVYWNLLIRDMVEWAAARVVYLAQMLTLEYS
jgi:hypothetical protein